MSWWSRFSDRKLNSSEQRLLEKSETEVTTENVAISPSLQLFCLKFGDTSKPLLIILHGYCGSGIVFFKMFKRLSQDYRVILVDLLGMGRSSRPDFTCSSLEDSEDFFVESLESFRRAKGIESFTLIGHSFGGYIAGCYSIKYPQFIEKLLLLSPVGLAQSPREYSYLESLKERDWKFRWLMKFVVFFWAKNITPLALMRKAGPLGSKLMGLYTKNRILGLDHEERDLIGDYLEQINLLPQSGELALAIIMEPGAWAKHPLCRRMKHLQVPMAFFYGDRDWVSRDGVEDIKEYLNCKVVEKTISNAGHHMYYDNPSELVEELVEALKELDQ